MRYGKSLKEFTWVKVTDGCVPPNAVQGGHEPDGKPLFICRQWHKGGLHVGKTAPHLKGCFIAFGGKEIHYKECFVLCGDASLLRWIEVKGQCKPLGWEPLEAGNEENGTELWVAKVRHDNSEQLGKVSPEWKYGCNYGFDSRELNTGADNSYFVLAVL